MLDAASVVQDEVTLSPRPHLPPSDSDAADNLSPKVSDGEDKDKDEDVVADAAAALLVLLPDVDPPS